MSKCKPHRFEVFSELHQCIHCGMRIVDHQRIEKLEKRITDLQLQYDNLVEAHEDAVHRFVAAEGKLSTAYREGFAAAGVAIGKELFKF